MSVRKSLFAVTLVTTLALATSAVAAERETGPRGGGGDSKITRIVKRFIIHLLDDFSFPPPH